MFSARDDLVKVSFQSFRTKLPLLEITSSFQEKLQEYQNSAQMLQIVLAPCNLQYLTSDALLLGSILFINTKVLKFILYDNDRVAECKEDFSNMKHLISIVQLLNTYMWDSKQSMLMYTIQKKSIPVINEVDIWNNHAALSL